MVRPECRPVRPQASNTRAHLHGRCRILPIKQVRYVGLALEEHRRTRTRNRSRPSNSLGMAPRIPLDTNRKLVARLVARLQFDGLISEERRRIPGTINISANRNQGPKSTRRLSSILLDTHLLRFSRSRPAPLEFCYADKLPGILRGLLRDRGYHRKLVRRPANLCSASLHKLVRPCRHRRHDSRLFRNHLNLISPLAASLRHYSLRRMFRLARPDRFLALIQATRQ